MAGYIVDGRSAAARQAYKESQTSGRVAISVMTQAELLYGLEKKPTAIRLRQGIESLLSDVEILPWDSTAAYAYAKLRARMNAAGKSLTAFDMLIAAHAAAEHAILVTHDRAFLHASPFLEVTDWATDL